MVAVLGAVQDRLQESVPEHGDEDVIAVYRTMGRDAARSR
jgi:hypothetical protein